MISVKIRAVLVLAVSLFWMGCGTKKSEAPNPNETIADISNPLDELVGEYATKPNGEVTIRITKTEDRYFYESLENGTWYPPKEVKEVDVALQKTMFGANSEEFVEFGLSKDLFGVFKVKRDKSFHGHTFKSEYMMMLLVPIDVYKL